LWLRLYSQGVDQPPFYATVVLVTEVWGQRGTFLDKDEMTLHYSLLVFGFDSVGILLRRFE